MCVTYFIPHQPYDVLLWLWLVFLMIEVFILGVAGNYHNCAHWETDRQAAREREREGIFNNTTPACSPVCLSACLPVCLSACPPVRLSTCPPVRLCAFSPRPETVLEWKWGNLVPSFSTSPPSSFPWLVRVYFEWVSQFEGYPEKKEEEKRRN